jgi:hypothetical protein
MNNNHIGTAFELMKDIATEEGWNYSHGTLTELDFKAFLVFPLMHCSIQSVALTDQVATIQMNVMVADRVNFLKTENEQENLITEYSEYGYTENQNYGHILQDLYVRFSKGLWRTEQNTTTKCNSFARLLFNHLWKQWTRYWVVIKSQLELN